MEALQIGEQIVLQGHIAGADADLTGLQRMNIPEHILSPQEIIIALADQVIERFPLGGQPDSLGSTVEQPGIQLRFQMLDGLAHRRLGDKQTVGCG